MFEGCRIFHKMTKRLAERRKPPGESRHGIFKYTATRKPRLLCPKCGGSALRLAQRASLAMLLQPPPRTAKPRLGSPPARSTTAESVARFRCFPLRRAPGTQFLPEHFQRLLMLRGA